MWLGPSLDIAVRHRVGSLSLDMTFTLDRPWTVLFAPSGAGKTTLLRIVAGLQRPQSGRIECRSTGISLAAPGRTYAGLLLDTAANVFMPPHERHVRLVGQQPALFPHETALQNVWWGVNWPDSDTVQRQFCMGMLEMCGAGHLAEKLPAQLSGGEQQRVALARALATLGGRALLLDEPFSALDGAARNELMRATGEWGVKQKTPVLHVTHDVGEVFASGAEVIRMEGGRVVAHGEASVVLGEERQRLLRQLEAR